MEFQRFLDPFGTALKLDAMQLANTSKGIENATNLYKLGVDKIKYEQMIKEMTETTQAGNDFGGPVGPVAGVNGKGSLTPPSAELYKLANFMGGEYKRMKYTDPVRAQAALNKAETTYKQAVDQQNKEFEQEGALMTSLQDFAAQASVSPSALGPAYAMLTRKVPPGVDLNKLLYGKPEEGGLGLVQGPTGYPIYDQKSLEGIGHFSKTAREMRAMKHQEFMEQSRLEMERIAAAGLKVREEAEVRRAAAQRDADNRRTEAEGRPKLKPGMMWADKDDPAKGMIPIPVIGNPKELEATTKLIVKDPLYANNDKYQQALGVVRTLEAKINANVPPNAADMQQLRSHYQNIKEDFRARVGTVAGDREFAKLNGVVQSLNKYIETIGSATPAVALSSAKTAMAVITDEVATRQINLLKFQLTQAAKLEKAGGDPNKLPLKGDVRFLTSRVDPVDKKPYAIIRPDTEDSDKKWIFFKDDPTKGYLYPEGAF